MTTIYATELQAVAASSTIGRLSILRGEGNCTKSWHSLTDKPASGAPVRWWRHDALEVESLQDLADALKRLSLDPQAIVVRGDVRPDWKEQQRRQANEKTGELLDPHGRKADMGLMLRRAALFADTGKRWVGFDVDKFPMQSGESEKDAARRWLAENIPGAAGCRFVLQLSASHGHPLNAGTLRAHVWLLLTEPRTCMELMRWHTWLMTTGQAGAAFDQVTLRLVQPHYVAAPLMAEGLVDPVPQRVVLVEGARAALAVDMAAVEAWESEQERKRQRDRQEAIERRRSAPTLAADGDMAKGLIDLFNERYTVDQVLARNGYEPDARGVNWRHPGSESGSFSCVVNADTGRAFTLSSADPLHVAEGSATGRAHDAFSAFAVLEHGGDQKAALRAAGAEVMVTFRGERMTHAQASRILWQESQPRVTFGDGEPASGETGERPRFRLLSGDDLRALPPMRWRVKGLMPQRGVASIYGPSTGGKSFMAIDQGCAVAEGREWFGLRTTQAPVVYIALEGEAGIANRVRAWEIANGRPLPEAMNVIIQPFKLVDAADVEALAEVVPQGAVVYIDTTNRAAPGADENSSVDMGRILQGAKALAERIAGLVVLVHHTGKDATKGMRGHSSLFAAMDAAIEVLRDGDRRAWRNQKVKDGRDGDEFLFRLSVVELGADEDGDPVTSCVVRPDKATADVRTVKLPQGGNQRLVLEAIRPLFKDGQRGRPGAPPLRPCIELEAAVRIGAGSLTCASDKRASRTREALTGLISRGVLGLHEGWLWLV